MVERILISDTYPYLKDSTLRVYLLLCRQVGFSKNATSFMAATTMAKELNVTEYRVYKELNWLEEHRFIKKVGKRGRADKYIVLTIPDYCKGAYYSNEHIIRSRFELKQNNRGYIEMPVDFLQGRVLNSKKTWTDKTLLIMMKLYQYYWLDVYGGVYPKMVTVDTNQQLKVSDSFCYEVGSTPKQAIKKIETLIKQKYLYFIDGVYRRNINSYIEEYQFVGDVGKVKMKPGDKTLTLLRPRIITQKNIEKAVTRLGVDRLCL
jgi:hypothetical protein